MHMTNTDIPRARIEAVQVDYFGTDTTMWIVVDQNGQWGGAFRKYADALDRLKTRQKVEKGMRTRRANKANKAR